MIQAKERLKQGVKLLVGLALVAYVLRSKMIDFSAVGELVFAPANLSSGIFFFCVSSILVTARWYLLAKAQGLSLRYGVMFQLTMIGNFFNTFMPGAVGGDVIKAWYVAGREPQRKTRAIFTVILDRAIGLGVFVSFAAITLLFYMSWLEGRTELRLLAYSLWIGTASALVFAAVYFTPAVWRWRPVRRLGETLGKVNAVRKLVEAGTLYREKIPTVAGAVGLSIASFTGMIFLFYIQGNSLGIPLDLSHYFFVVPIAMTVSAIPLLPGGIGVGQVAFFTLFKWMGLENPEQGATLCTLIQIYMILFNCAGALFYFRFRRSPVEISTSSAENPAVLKNASLL